MNNQPQVIIHIMRASAKSIRIGGVSKNNKEYVIKFVSLENKNC